MIETLKEAGAGWSKIFSRTAGWESHFRLDAEGMNAGFTAFAAAVLVAMVLISVRIGFPPPGVMAVLMAGHVIPLVTLVAVTAIARRVVGHPGGSAGFLVPGLYLIALMKVIEAIAILAGMPLAGAITALTALLGYRLARANGFAMAPAIGYALAIFVLLAGLPAALYMVGSAL